MARLTPSEAQQKQARNLKNATSDIRSGIERVSEAPGQKAARKQDKMLQNITESISSGKWAQRVSSVSLEDWKKKAIEKGIPRISAGIDAAADKTTAFFEQLFAHQDSGLAKIKSMSDLTLDDSIARMTEWTRHMAKFKRR